MPTSKNQGKSEPKIERKPIASLEFDTSNPRIVDQLGKDATQTQIYELLTNEMEASELIPSFIQNGFIPLEPLIVRVADKRNIVMEGNRRLAALLTMQTSDDEEEKSAFKRHGLNTVPCMVFTGDDNEALAYLGLRHVSKTKDWSPFAKAAFMERLVQRLKSVEAAARLTNVKQSELRLMLLIRHVYRECAELGIELPSGRASGDTSYWYLGDALRRKNTKLYLELQQDEDPLVKPSLNQSKLETLIRWIYGNPKTKEISIVTNTADVRKLDSSLGHVKAIAVLESGGSLEDALAEIEAAGVRVSSNLEKAKKAIQRATGGLSDVEGEGIKEVQIAWGSLEKAIAAFKTALPK